MMIQRTSRGWQISAPAKVNLFLEVLGKRGDGYHELETVLCPISLFDQLILEPTADNDIALQLHTPRTTAHSNQPANATSTSAADEAWEIPSDDRNLVVRGVRRVQQALGTRRGCHIQLHKSIPAAAGLGGGSSDAAAAVVASLLAWGHWDRQLAQALCAELGSDVPFFLADQTGIGLALATGRGEHCQQLRARPALELVVTHPPVGCQTQQVYLNYAEHDNKQDFRKIVAACETGQAGKIGAQLFNALQLPASKLTDWIGRQLNLFAAAGVQYALMSGSGSSCFGVIADPTCVARIRNAAADNGLQRVYSVYAWYGDSIEQQLLRQYGL